MYVARFTADPIDDIERGWSGYMGCDFKTVADAIEFHGVETGSLSDEDSLLDLLARENIDLRFDKRLNSWRVVHHEGLSCFPLASDTLNAALSEAAGAELRWEGFGSRTLGKVNYCCPVSEIADLYIFQCDEAVQEY